MHHAPNHQTAGLHGMNEGMTREELAAWLQLVQAKGIGHGTVRRLLAAFGLPQQILAQSTAALEQLLSAKQIAALRTPDAETLALIETTWQWLQQGAAPAAGSLPQDRPPGRCRRACVAACFDWSPAAAAWFEVKDNSWFEIIALRAKFQ